MKLTYFTIIAVCKDAREMFYRDFLESIAAQDYDSFELYVIDGGNNFDVKKITDEFFPQDVRVHYRMLKKRTSKAYGTNIGFHFAEGDYVIVVNCHNRLDPHCLYHLADYIFDKGESDVIYSDHIDLEGVDKTNIHVKQDFNKELFLRDNYLGDMIVMRSDAYKRVGQIKEALTEEYMYDYLIRCMEKGLNIRHIPKFLYYKRITSSDIDTKLKESKSIIQLLMDNPLSKRRSDNDYGDIRYKEAMAAVKAYLTRNDIDARISEDSSHRFIKVEYNGEGAAYKDKDYILLKGKDVKVSGRHYLDKMYGYIRQKNVAVVGVRFAKPFWLTENCGYIYDTSGNTYPAFYNYRLRDGGYDNIQLIPREVSMVDPDFCMINAKVFRALGGFDTALSGRDIMLDFCLRARKRGYRTIVDPTILAKRATYDNISSETSHNLLVEKHADVITTGDPYYSPNFVMGVSNHRFMEADDEVDSSDS